MKLSAIRVNGAAIEGGAWVLVPQLGSVRLKVRGTEYAPFLRRRAVLIRDAQTQARLDGVPASDVDTKQAEVKAFVEHVLIDWAGIEDEDGAPLLFSPAQAEELLQSMDMIDLWAACLWAAGEVRRTAFAEQESVLKN